MRRAAALLLIPVLLTACSSGKSAPPALKQPKQSAFKEGPCRTVAPQILMVGRDATKLGKDKAPPTAVRDSLKRSQDVLAAVQEGLDPALVAPFSKLVISIGLVRLRSDANSYGPELSTQLSQAYQELVTACTT